MGDSSYRFEEHNATMNNATFRSISQSILFDDFALDDVLSQENEDKRQELLHAGLERTAEMENVCSVLLGHIIDSTFLKKYGLDFSMPQAIHSYLFTRQPRQHTYVFEAFASVLSLAQDTMKHKKEEMVFYKMFEDLIERYTKTCAKPNPILLETRNSEFCYRLTMIVEAVPIEAQSTVGFGMSTLRLLREYEILKYVWEKFRMDIQAKSCSLDHLVGVPMPFEFVNVTGTEYDFDRVKCSIYYFDIHGAYVPVATSRVPETGRPLESFLSYMSMEKLGPSLSYLGDLLKSQKKWFTVSTALKILDQIMCRLMVLHRYGVIVGNMDMKFLNFGVREAVNVLYLNNFDCAVVAPTKQKPLPCFNERFASTGVLKGSTHFVNDIETAFYIFLNLLVPRLPWDAKQSQRSRDGSWGVGDSNLNRDLKQHLSERHKLWDSSAGLDRILHSFPINMDSTSPIFEGFAFDIIQMVYLKTKEAITACSRVSHQEFMTNTMTVSTAAHNAFTSIRKVIVTFFRFETLSSSLKDATCQNKVDRLLNAESADTRALWDLNNWCWNAFETSYLSARRTSTRSMKF